MQIKLLDAVELPRPRVYSSHTDADLVKQLDHLYPEPGDPLLAEVFQRFRDHASNSVRIEDSEVTAHCPNCNSKLLVQIEQ